MFIDDYFNEPGGRVCFTREQASGFAKHVADDFNPIHDIDSKRFCVPGDLLFAVMLAKYGVSQHMQFVFSGMVSDGVELVLPQPGPQLSICDAQGREYLQVQRGGGNSLDASLVENLTRSYVAFSGHTFPHILAPLLKEQQVMINPQRPMVIYQSMEIDLDTLDITAPTLVSERNELQIDGKRGAVLLAFRLMEGERVVGRGCKRMLMSGLRPFDDAAFEAGVSQYLAHKDAYAAGA
ncbi:MAG: hypothetical protein CME59_05480 [Halioglobus sp.]|nr:hypothetical protein [Halioglobus sp.]|tara:strand:+ start:74 stop:784 length:711 start_codon:yes stop_codon:yes gene_type:complete